MFNFAAVPKLITLIDFLIQQKEIIPLVKRADLWLKITNALSGNDPQAQVTSFLFAEPAFLPIISKIPSYLLLSLWG
jgi:hypothetical protein